MRIVRHIGSLAFVLGLFTVVFIGVPWHVMVSDDPVVPWLFRIAVFCILGGILVVLLTVALEQRKIKPAMPAAERAGPDKGILLLNTAVIPGKEIVESLGIVQGHTVFAIWLGKDLSALVRLILGGELTEYTEMMASARKTATQRMVSQATELGADAVINIRYMTTSVIGSAAELLAYGTAVKLKK
jgi:uncharacterized protein YbjQ (UPF0145 family)